MDRKTKRRILGIAAGFGLVASVLVTLYTLVIFALASGWNPFFWTDATVIDSTEGGWIGWGWIKYILLDLGLIALTIFCFVMRRRMRTK